MFKLFKKKKNHESNDQTALSKFEITVRQKFVNIMRGLDLQLSTNQRKYIYATYFFIAVIFYSLILIRPFTKNNQKASELNSTPTIIFPSDISIPDSLDINTLKEQVNSIHKKNTKSDN